MTQIIVRLPYDQLTQEEQRMVTETAVTFGIASLKLASDVHLMWVDESLSLLIAIIRVAPKTQLPYLDILTICFNMASVDQEQAKFFILA
jgi:hypothetical protein